MSPPLPAKPVLTMHPAETDVSVEANAALTLQVTPDAPSDSVEFTWDKDGHALAEGLSEGNSKYHVAVATEEHSGSYRVTAWRKGEDDAKSEEVQTAWQVSVAGAATPSPGQPPPPPLEWDAGFARWVVGVAVGLTVGMFAVVLVVAFLKEDIAWTIALGLLSVLAVLTCFGVAVALIDLRGRARAAQVVTDRSIFGDALDKAPEILKAWGSLSLAAALLALAAIAIIALTVLGYRSLPDPAGTPSSSPSAAASQSTEPSSSALSPSSTPS